MDLLQPAAYVLGFFAAAVALGLLGASGYLAYQGLRGWPGRQSVGRNGQMAKALLLAPAVLLVAGVVAFVAWLDRTSSLLAQEQEKRLRQIEQERQQGADRKARLFNGLVGRYVFADTGRTIGRCGVIWSLKLWQRWTIPICAIPTRKTFS